jgi:prepilin-type processing-associated H-X9-DG protein/prepilin-type N-terminal cleavage/methylation domain-containing protein
MIGASRIARRLSAGFTLVELLVVIGIIALLIAILMPALSRAMGASREVKCLANLRSIGQAAVLHAHDHKGYFPVAGALWPPATSATPAGLFDSAAVKYSYYIDDDGKTRPNSIAGALAQYAGQTVRLDSKFNLEKDLGAGTIRKMFLCPSDDEGLLGVTITSTLDSNWHSPMSRYSYAFNEAALNIAGAGGGGGNATARARGNLSAIPHSSDTLFMCDGKPRAEYGDLMLDIFDHGQNVTLGDVNSTGNPAGLSSIFDSNRHRGRINVGFMDGHAETLPLVPNSLKRVSLNKDFQ